MAVGVGKSVVNSPLLKCAVNGNDPNVGRLISSIGKYFAQPNSDEDR
jgi:glutamate N-acetyltransferase/amino-acid N-acetyltransferase